VSLDDAARAAQKVLHPDQLVWVIVGDRAKIEPALRALNWSDLRFLDPDGNPVK